MIHFVLTRALYLGCVKGTEGPNKKKDPKGILFSRVNTPGNIYQFSSP